MARLGKSILFIILILVCTSMLVVNSTTALSLSAPRFTVKVIDSSYTVPISHSTDPYTGQTTNQGGTSVQTRNVTFVIDNVPQANYYLIEFRGHYSTVAWTPITAWGLNVTASASSGSQTIITISSSNPEQSSITDPLYWGNWAYNFAPNSVIDFRVQAVSGSESNDPLFGYSANHPIIVGTVSPWSTQTITIDSTSTNASPSPSVPEFPITASLVAVLAAVSLLLVIGKRKLTVEC
jgi:hypothetical protein